MPVNTKNPNKCQKLIIIQHIITNNNKIRNTKNVQMLKIYQNTKIQKYKIPKRQF